ncbi:hypothetical protein GUJ93_ZPchr0013g36475 [Zizania palustris]|uniref:Bromo domain-containing protein n=1 Tax=Zizania palustris TaxID=103762 RepID=A0A8J5WVK2_ZIZPA|nr:hypothetical protein GUJ93_ZPchr0013g36475 [Zizania palustris]
MSRPCGADNSGPTCHGGEDPIRPGRSRRNRKAPRKNTTRTQSHPLLSPTSPPPRRPPMAKTGKAGPPPPPPSPPPPLAETPSPQRRRKKKGRPSLLDLQRRSLRLQAPNPNPAPSPSRRDPNPSDEDEDGVGSGRRRQKRLKSVLSGVGEDEAAAAEEKDTAKATGRGDAASGGGPTGTPLPDKKLLLFILDRLQKKDTYGVFSEPVDPEELPDYHDIIEHPMDFSTIQQKLSNDSYSSLDQFEGPLGWTKPRRSLLSHVRFVHAPKPADLVFHFAGLPKSARQAVPCRRQKSLRLRRLTRLFAKAVPPRYVSLPRSSLNLAMRKNSEGAPSS